MMESLEKIFENVGLPKNNIKTFKAVILKEKLTGDFSNYTVESLLCRPYAAIQFCTIVRLKANVDLTDPVILNTLLTMKKCGEVA